MCRPLSVSIFLTFFFKSDSVSSSLGKISISKSKKKHFPLEELMDEGIKKSLTITEDQINDI